MMTKEISLLTQLLECGEFDIPLIADIDSEIIERGLQDIKYTQSELNFSNLYYFCAIRALQQIGIIPDKAKIDCNYLCASISMPGISKKKIKILEELGFRVYG